MLRPAAMDRLFDEVRDRLREELDYGYEAENLRVLAAFHAERHPWVRVPEVVAARSGARVLCMTREDGAGLDEVAPREGEGWDAALRHQLATRLVELSFDELFVAGALHGDPNPANLAFRRDGSIVLYDFGCVRRYAPDWLEAMRDVLVALRARDPGRLDAALVRFGARRADHPPLPDEVWAPWIELLAPGVTPGCVLDFARAGEVQATMARLGPGMIRWARAIEPPPEIGVLKRVVVGHGETLGRLGVRLDVGSLLAPHLRAAGER